MVVFFEIDAYDFTVAGDLSDLIDRKTVDLLAVDIGAAENIAEEGKNKAENYGKDQIAGPKT